MKNSLTLILLLTTLLFYAQQRSVNKLGVETIRYGKIVKSYIDDFGDEILPNDDIPFPIAEYVFDGNPFNDNEKALKIYLKGGTYSYIKISHSDVSEEKIEFVHMYSGSYEFIFDNDKSSYFKLDKNSEKDIKSLDNELFLKFKKHKKAIVRIKDFIDSKDEVIDLEGFTAAYNKYMEVKSPTEKNKNLYKVSNGLANVNPFNLDKYIDKFILDAKKNHNIDLSYVNKRDRLILFKELSRETIATAYKMNDDDSVLVLVDPENWYEANQAKRWYIIYHELGHDILNLEHGECGPMMDKSTSGSYTWSRLEKDKAIMFNNFKKKGK